MTNDLALLGFAWLDLAWLGSAWLVCLVGDLRRLTDESISAESLEEDDWRREKVNGDFHQV